MIIYKATTGMFTLASKGVSLFARFSMNCHSDSRSDLHRQCHRHCRCFQRRYQF